MNAMVQAPVGDSVDAALTALREALDVHAPMARALADVLNALASADEGPELRPGTEGVLSYALVEHVDGMNAAMNRALVTLQALRDPDPAGRAEGKARLAASLAALEAARAAQAAQD
jgi:hypothetical protein